MPQTVLAQAAVWLAGSFPWFEVAMPIDVYRHGAWFVDMSLMI